MKQYATTLILWASLLVNEAHTLFSDRMITYAGRPMALSWFVWFVSNSLWGVMVAAAILFYKDNRINRTTVKAYFLFCVVDAAMLFINFKQREYESIYTLLLIGWVIIYNHGTKERKGNTYPAER